MSSHFTPTPAELALVNQIFAQADTQKIGILTGDVAVRVFGGAKLAPTVLGEIWGIADEDNNGFLTRKGVAVAVRLMGWAQKGEKISQALLNKSGPLASIDGVVAPLVPQGTGMSIPKSPPPGLPPLSPQDKVKFAKLFQGCGPVNGLLSGEKARNVFVKSKLPVDKLSQIWSLADTQDRGALDMADFTIAMYFIQATMSNQLSFIPTVLPPGLHEQAGGAPVVAHATGSSAHLASPASSSSFPSSVKQQTVQSQYTGQPNLLPAPPSRRAPPIIQTPAVPPFPGAATQTTGNWDITPVEKASADRFFDTLDSHKQGYIEGDVAVPFMLQSKLSEDVLAQVWDLSDINNDGRLTRDGFAVAMHLIQGKLSGKEIPATLPPSLVPPSMRVNGPASPFAVAPSQQSTETIHDLLWDDSPPASTVKTQPQTNALQHHIAPSSTSSHTVSRLSPSLEDPFASATHNSFHKDLLGDDEDAHPPLQLHDRSVEIGNIQNHVNSTSKSLQNAKAEREALEATLASQAAQLAALQTQLDTAKAAFETETGLLGALKERHANQNAEIQKVREELIRSESDLSAVRVEKADIEGSFLRDKEEVRELNRRMGEVTVQITAAKQEVEKVRKDAKQQKGLLAIARKQFATKESEKTKVDQELEEAQEDLANAILGREQAEAEIGKASEPERAKSPADSLSFAAAQPLPITPDTTGGGPMSPSSVRSNNPFEKQRLAMTSGTPTPRSESPFRSFSAVSMPLPPGLPAPLELYAPNVAVTTADDPFGVSQVFDAGSQPTLDVAPDNDAGASTPKMKAIFEENSEVVSSPTEDEFFSTPPNSITPVHLGGDATPHVPSLDSAAAHFPALDDLSSSVRGGKEQETDLSTSLHDLDVNETDSDTDSDEEEGHDQKQESRSPDAPIKNESTAPSNPVSFDDIFSATNDAPVVIASPVTEATPKTENVNPIQNGSAGFDAFGVPLIKPAVASEDGHDSGFTFVNTPVNLASKDSSFSFDDAFGKTSAGGPSQTASNFSFDSAFEDNFEFPASSGTTEHHANGTALTQPNTVPTVNKIQEPFLVPINGIAAVKAIPAQAPASFDDAFSSASLSAKPIVEHPVTDQPSVNSISFEEAFGGLDASKALRLDESFPSRTSDIVANSASSPHSEATKQFPVVSPPTSPQGRVSPRVTSSIRSGSPQPRTTSPPPRVGSPKTQRPSTSSSSAKEVVHEKPAPPPRHSKISIRLPFGKKKKQETLPPMPVPQSAQHSAQEPGIVVPSIDDDVEPVKQLAAMGFSRNQAVAALEAHDYNFQRALNSLLGG